MNHIEFRPYPHIPIGQLPEDIPLSREALPTPQSTVLFSPAEKLVMQDPRLLKLVEEANGRIAIPISLDHTSVQPFFLVASMMAAEDAHVKKDSMSSLRNFSWGKFPLNYNAVSYQLAVQYDENDERGQMKLDNTAKELGVFIQPPQHIDFSFVLEEHSLQVEEPDAYETKKQAMKDHFQEVFKPREKNVVIVENVEKGFSAKLFIDGIKKYRSFTKALYYSSYVLQFRSEPSERDLYVLGYIAKATGKAHPHGAYYRVMYETLDELNEEGYHFRIAFENGKDIDISSRFQTVHDVIQWHEKKKENTKTRDIAVAKQITAMAGEYRDCPKRVNILAVFGTEHHTLPEYLPDILLQRIKSIEMHDDTYTTHPLIQYEKGEISLEELARAYNVPVA